MSVETKMTKEEAIKYSKEMTSKDLLEQARKGGDNEPYDWNFLCTYFSLPEHFMEEYASELDWEAASIYQCMAKTFMYKFRHDIVWEHATLTQEYDEEFIESVEDFIDWDVLFYSKVLSQEFLKKNVFRFKSWIKNCHEDSKNEYSISRREEWFKTPEGSKLKNILFTNLRNIGAMCIHDEDYENDITTGDIDDLITSAEKLKAEQEKAEKEL